MGFTTARRRVATVAAMIFTASLITACGGSSSKSAAGSGGTATTSSSSFAAATAANAKFEKRPTSIGITTPVGARIPTGKVVDFIQCGVPACAVEGELLTAAADRLGWKLVPINAGNTPQTIINAYQQAITNKPDAVIGSGYPRSLFNPEIKTLQSMKIPVLEAFTGDPTGNGVYEVGGPRLDQIQGQEIADFILANARDATAKIGTVIPSGFANEGQEAVAFRAEVKRQCPGCTVKDLSVPVTSIGTDLPTRVTSFLTANPKIKWTWVGFSDMVTGLPTALKGAGIDTANLATLSLNGSVASAIQTGPYVQSGMGVTFPEIYWREIDLLARMFSGKSYAVDLNDATLPYWTPTKATLPANAGSATFANVVSYKQQYEKLWK